MEVSTWQASVDHRLRKTCAITRIFTPSKQMQIEISRQFDPDPPDQCFIPRQGPKPAAIL
jgi:hypothetical protein